MNKPPDHTDENSWPDTRSWDEIFNEWAQLSNAKSFSEQAKNKTGAGSAQVDTTKSGNKQPSEVKKSETLAPVIDLFTRKRVR